MHSDFARQGAKIFQIADNARGMNQIAIASSPQHADMILTALQTAETAIERYARAWRTEAMPGGEYGIVVAEGKTDDPYYWVLCPAAATLYLSATDTDLTDCNIGASCDWEEIHKMAADIIRSR
jgi:hypothetical protein